MKKILIIILLIFSVLFFAIEVVITDVSSFSTDYSVVKYLVENRIMELDENGNFKPNLLMTKIDIARIVYKIIKLYNLELINKLEAQLNQINNDTKLTKSLISGMDERITIVENKQKDINEKFAKISIDFENMMANLSNLEKKIEDNNLLNIAEKVSNLEKNMVLKEEFDSIKNKVSTLENSFLNLNKDFSQKISIIDVEIENLKNEFLSQHSEINAQFENFKNSIQNLTVNFEEINNKIKSLDKFQNLESKVESLENSFISVNEKVNQLDELNNKIDSVNLSLDSLKQKLETLEKSYSEFESKMNYIDDKILKLESLSDEISNLENRIEKIEKLDLDGSKLSEISKNIENFANFIEETSKSVDELNSKIKTIDSKVNYLTIIAGGSILIAIISFLTALAF